MSTVYWKSSGFTDQGFATAGNWVGDTAPVDTDSVVFNAGSNPVDGSDQTGLELATVLVTDGYTGTLGSSGTYLQLDADDFVFGGQGATNYVSFTPDGTLNVLVYSTGTGANALHIQGQMDRITLLQGNVTLDSSSALAANAVVIVGYTSAVSTDVSFAVGTGVTNLTDLILYGGTTTTTSAITTVRQFAGTLTHTTGAVTTLDLFGGACNWQSTGTLTTLNAYDGSFDASGQASAKTITTIRLYRAALDLDNGARNITVTNGILAYTDAPSITDGFGRTWTIT